MIYSRDLWAQLPTKDLYDTNIMMAAVSAAKDMYDKGQKRIDDFYEKYGLFYSPFAKDMERYGLLMQGITNPLEELYAQGIDPIRSAEGRALVSRLVNSFPVADFNTMKTNAKYGEEYLKQVGNMRQKDLFNLDYENWLIGQQFGNGTTFENFDSSKGIWNRPAPGEFKTIDDIVEPIVKNLNPIFDLEYSKKMNDGFDYYTVSPERIASTLADSLPDIMNTDIGRYYMSKAMSEANNDPILADAIFRNQMIDRARDNVRFDRKENSIFAENLRYKHQLGALTHAHALDMEKLRQQREWAKEDEEEKEIKKRSAEYSYNQHALEDSSSSVYNLPRTVFNSTTMSNSIVGQQTENLRGIFGVGKSGKIRSVINLKAKGLGDYVKRFLNSQSSYIDPLMFAHAYSTGLGIKNHSSARPFDVSDIQHIYTGTSLLGLTNGISIKKDTGNALDSTKEIREKLKHHGDLTGHDTLKSIRAVNDTGQVYIEPIERRFGHVDKHGLFRSYVKVRFLNSNGKDLFPGEDLYIFDGTATQENPAFKSTGQVNMFGLDPVYDSLRMRYENNFSSWQKLKKEDMYESYKPWLTWNADVTETTE